MEIFDVVIPNDEPSFSSFESAIHAVAKTTRSITAQADTAKHKSKTIVDARYTTDTFIVDLDTGESVEYRLNGGTVEWSIAPTKPMGPTDDDDPLAASCVHLQFRMPEVHAWDREAIRSRLLGSQLTRIGSCIAVTYLQTTRRNTLWFSRVIIKDRNVLFCDFD